MALGLDRAGIERVAFGHGRELALLHVGIVALVAVDHVGEAEALVGDDRAAGGEDDVLPRTTRLVGRASRTVTVSPVASVICEAIVRFQISSYTSASARLTSRATCSGERKESPAGRMASCASWAFLTFLA